MFWNKNKPQMNIVKFPCGFEIEFPDKNDAGDLGLTYVYLSIQEQGCPIHGKTCKKTWG